MANISYININNGEVVSPIEDEAGRAMTCDKFDPEKDDYVEGDLCIYENVLYKFTESKTEKGWDRSKVKETTIAKELSAVNTKISINTFGAQVTLTKNVEYICPADGYFRITCGYERSSIARGYVNGVDLLALSSTNNDTITLDNTTFASVYVRAGMAIKYTGTNAKGYYRPISIE